MNDNKKTDFVFNLVVYILLVLIVVSTILWMLAPRIPPPMKITDRCITMGTINASYCATRNAKLDAGATATAEARIPDWWPWGH